MSDCSCTHCGADLCRGQRNIEIRRIAYKVKYLPQFIQQGEKIMNSNRGKYEKYDDLGVLMIHSMRRNPKIAYAIHEETQKIIKIELLKSLEIFDDSE